ncbi:MAG: trypsin-like peptidase domain-containing protein, partial [bacterium]|nr:trypsin-like peptidase domain-containing protein [bacterium]
MTGARAGLASTALAVVHLMAFAAFAQGVDLDGAAEIWPLNTLPEPLQVGTEVVEVFETDHPYWGPANDELQLVWSARIHHPDASYIAPHFARFDLAPGDYVVVRSPGGERSWRYEGQGKGESGVNGGFWAVHIPGDTALIELHSRNAVGGYGVAVDRFARGFQAEEIGVPQRSSRALCDADDSQWAMCYSDPEPDIYDKSRAVARLLINGTGACTGWLVGSEGHLLTNNHCIGSSSDAENTNF